MDTIEPSSTTISEPGGIRPCRGRPAAGWCSPPPGRRRLRSSLVAFCEVAVPNTGPVPGPGGGGQDPGLAGPGRAGDHLDGAGRGEHVPDGGGLVQPQPALRGLLACVLRALAQLRLQQRASAPRRRAASSPRQPRRALRLRLRDQLLFGRQLRGGGVPRGAGPRVDAAPVQLAAQRRRAAAATPAPPGRRRPRARPDRASSARPSSSSCAACGVHVPGLRGHHQGELLEQVVPGPGRTASPTPAPAPCAPPAPAPPATAGPPASGPPGSRPPSAAACARAGPRAFDTAGAMPRQLAADRGVPPRGQRVPVDLHPRPCPCVTAASPCSRCRTARVSSARARSGAPTPARVRVPSRAPARCAWNRRPSAPA